MIPVQTMIYQDPHNLTSQQGLTKVVPELAPMRNGALCNMAKWSKLAATSQENNGTTTDILEHCHSLERGPSIDPPPEAPPRIPDG